MKRMTKIEIDSKARDIQRDWVCIYSERNANKLSMAVRRLFRKQKEQKQS
jgi:hypothetical protein